MIMRLIDADELCLGKFPEIRTDYHTGWNDALDAAATQAPTVDAVPVVHWRRIEYQVPRIICCSECDWGTGVDEKSNYCPHCGAKMDGKEE